MARTSKFFNPFFLLLGVVGAVFAISALVYGVMSIQFSHAVGNWAEQEPRHPLLLFFRAHGTMVLGAELACLAILTVAAIWTDDYWAKRAQSRVGTTHQRIGTTPQHSRPTPPAAPTELASSESSSPFSATRVGSAGGQRPRHEPR